MDEIWEANSFHRAEDLSGIFRHFPSLWRPYWIQNGRHNAVIRGEICDKINILPQLAKIEDKYVICYLQICASANISIIHSCCHGNSVHCGRTVQLPWQQSKLYHCNKSQVVIYIKLKVITSASIFCNV